MAAKQTTPRALSPAPVGMRLVRWTIGHDHAMVPVYAIRTAAPLYENRTAVPLYANRTAVPVYAVADRVMPPAGAKPDCYRNHVSAVAGVTCTPGKAAGAACPVHVANFHPPCVFRASLRESCPCAENYPRRGCEGG